MAYLTCPIDIDFSHVHDLISLGKGIPMKKGCTIGMRFMHVSVIFTLCLCFVTFISKLALGMVYKGITRHLNIKEMNRGLGMLEAGCFHWHVAGVLGVSQNTVARVWERFQTHGNVRWSWEGQNTVWRPFYCHQRVTSVLLNGNRPMKRLAECHWGKIFYSNN